MTQEQLLAVIGQLYIENFTLRGMVESLNSKVSNLEKNSSNNSPPAQMIPESR